MEFSLVTVLVRSMSHAPTNGLLAAIHLVPE